VCLGMHRDTERERERETAMTVECLPLGIHWSWYDGRFVLESSVLPMSSTPFG
jgi:hypothetical protein